MRPIVYVAGSVADHLGSDALKEIATLIATLSDTPIDILTHGESEFHRYRRIQGEPLPVAAGVAYRKLSEVLHNE